VGAALHVVEARVRPGSPPRIYGEAIDRSKTWTPEAPWTGVLISRALAEVLPAGLVQPVRAPFAAPGEPGESGDGSDTWFRPAAPGPLMTGDHERYVGQAAALARGRASLRASLARAEPGLCTIVGGHGMGKSRLCVELTRMIAEEAPDISPLLVQASRVAPGCPDPVLDALAREIARVTGESPHASAVSDPAAVSALGDGLRRAASVEPLAILVDDCHHASDALLSVLEYAALDADSERADDDDPPRVPLWICVAAGRSLLRRRPRWGQRGERHVSIELEPLSDAEAAELAAALLRPVDYPPPELLDQLVEMSAGNPFLLVQICRNLKRLGMIRRGQQAGSFYIASEATGALPNLSVSQWLAGHELAQLPAPLAAFARVCAVLGGDFTRDELRRAVADAERDDTASTPLDIDVGLAMLERRGLIARDASAPDAGVRDAWSFVKPLFQDAIYRELAVADRTRIHRSASAHWRERADAASGPERERALVAIARHAEALRDHPAAIEAHLALGERARFAHRYVEADWHYTRALALIAEAEARDSIASRDSIAALRGRGVVRYRLHRLHESIQDLQSAAQIAERAGLVTDFIASLLEQSTSLDWAGEYSASAECVERAGERMEPDAEPGLRARYLTALGRSQYRRGDTASAIATLTEAHRSHEAVGDAEWAIITLLLLAPLLSFAGRVSDAEARFADAVALCEQHRDRFHLCVAYLNRAWLWLAEPDEPAEAIRHVLGDLHRARRIARQIGQPILERGAAHNIAEILHWSGKQRRALAHARRALTLQRFLPEPVVTDVLLVARAHAAARNWGEAKHHTERSRTIADAKPGSVQPGESLLLRALEQVVGDLADRGDERRARWGEISASADAELPAEERLEILYFRALDAERAGDREALGEALCSAREQLERTPLLTGLFAEITARSGAEPAQTG
jgi:tetratricopeptide (TPR) repeat protein